MSNKLNHHVFPYLPRIFKSLILNEKNTIITSQFDFSEPWIKYNFSIIHMTPFSNRGNANFIKLNISLLKGMISRVIYFLLPKFFSCLGVWKQNLYLKQQQSKVQVYLGPRQTSTTERFVKIAKSQEVTFFAKKFHLGCWC